MLGRVFLYLTSLSSTLKEKLWTWWYQRLAKYDYADWKFMNYGYVPREGEIAPQLNENEDEENRLFIQLYHHVLLGIPVEDKDVLEVGSGRGGGANYVARYLNPRKIVGLDISKNAVELCQRIYSAPNLTFVEGNSEKLPFANNSFDVVYNVESSHCYGNMQAFVDEVYRVLKPGGYFAWADLRPKEDVPGLEKVFSSAGFKVLSEEVITSQVLDALDAINAYKEEKIRERVPGLLKKVFSEFAGVKDSSIYTALKQGEFVYCCRKFGKDNPQ